MANSRRKLIKGMALAGASIVTASACSNTSKHAYSNHSSSQNPLLPETAGTLKKNINHSVSKWTYGHLSVEELCKLVKQLGFSAIDLVGPEDWPTLKKYGIDSSMCNGAELNLVDGWIHPQHHDELIKRYTRHIDLVAEAGYKNLVCFSGNARGMEPEQGLINAVQGLSKIISHAEKRGVILQMELFNSKVNHPDYMADNSAWGIELCRRLGSENFKLLYDIYHMQISEGDIIRTIKDNHQYFGHYHTAGVPGRNEIDETQELYYPAIAQAIKNTGFTGYLAQEFVPTPKDDQGKAESLARAIAICDV